MEQLEVIYFQLGGRIYAESIDDAFNILLGFQDGGNLKINSLELSDKKGGFHAKCKVK